MSQTEVALHLGDCLDVMGQIPPQSVHLFLCDFPYAITGHHWDVPVDLDKFWQSARRAGVPQNVSVLHATNPFAAVAITSNLKGFRYDMVWRKNSPSGFLQAKHRPLRAHEMMLVFAKGKHTYNPQMGAGKAYTHTAVTKGRKTYNTKNYTNKIEANSKRHPLSVLDYGVARYIDGRYHPTQKPVALLEHLIKSYTNEGDTILDPAAGSGTTAIAALRTGRNVVCIEKDPAYFEVMRKRIEDEQARLGFEVTV